MMQENQQEICICSIMEFSPISLVLSNVQNYGKSCKWNTQNNKMQVEKNNKQYSSGLGEIWMC